MGDNTSVKTLLVARQPGDHKMLEMPVSELSGFHFDSVTGGVGRAIAYNLLFAYMWCTSIPEGADFGHSCKHGPPPHRIKVCIPRVHNRGPVYNRICKTLDPEWGKPRKPESWNPKTVTLDVGRGWERTITLRMGTEYEVRPHLSSKKKHRGRKCVVLSFDYNKARVRFLDTNGIGRVDIGDLFAEGLSSDRRINALTK